jgi:hypothetical protein
VSRRLVVAGRFSPAREPVEEVWTVFDGWVTRTRTFAGGTSSICRWHETRWKRRISGVSCVLYG